MYNFMRNRKNKTLLLFSLIAIFLGSCKKKVYDEGLPTVRMEYVKLIGTDTAEMAGKVISAGADAIQYTGFCYGNDPKPAFTENQIVLDGTNGEFIIRIPVKHDTTYYFRAFATNGFGYVLTNPVPLKILHPIPAIAPCKLPDNVFTDNGTNFNITSVYTGSNYASFGTYGIEADAGSSESINLYFNITPVNGVYITQGSEAAFSDNVNSNEVLVAINDGFSSPTPMNSGDSVYVAENADHTLTISFCKLNYTVFSTNVKVSGSIKTR